MNWAYALTAAAAATAAVLTLTAASHAATITAGPACGMAQRTVQPASGGIWTLSRPNPFALPSAQAARFCIEPSTGPGFTITSNAPYDGTVRAFPFTGTGCAYDLCSRNTDLPKKVRTLPAAASMSWNWRGNPPGYWNAALDLWFSKYDQITGQDDGAELMIWTRTPAGYGSTPGVDFRHVKIGKHWYWFTAWRAHHGPLSWWYIQFRTPATVHGVHQLWMRPFIKYAEQRHLLKPSWWLTSVHAGYELWSGGRGLQTTWFNTHT